MNFTGTFPSFVCEDDRISVSIDGLDITARIVYDYDHGPPWEEGDGHGPVSGWRLKSSKRPGERILVEDRESARFYDVAGALETAKRDGWDAPPYGGTPEEKAARAVERDFQNLREWCRGNWNYVGVVLSVSRKGVTLDSHAASLWGIEANHPDGDGNAYLTEVANELLPEALEVGKAILADLCS